MAILLLLQVLSFEKIFYKELDYSMKVKIILGGKTMTYGLELQKLITDLN